MEIETVEEGVTLKNIVTIEEYEGIPLKTVTKIESYLEVQFEKYLTAKAIYESSNASTDEKIAVLTNELEQLKTQYELQTAKVKESAQIIERLEAEVKHSKSELVKSNENLSRYENEASEFRHQRDDAVDERDTLQKEVDHKTTEIETLRKDLADLTAQLNGAINAKCNALAKASEVESRELNCVYREKQMEQQQASIEARIKGLNEDLNKRVDELCSIRRDHTAKMMTIETKLTEKTEELKITLDMNKHLTETNAKLTAQTEKLTLTVLGLQKSENATQDGFRQEIDSKIKLIELYKLQAEEKDDNTMKLTSAISELQEMLHKATEECGKYETHLKQKQFEYEVALEEKSDTIKSLKLELEHANELLTAAKQESIDSAIESLAPSAAATSKLIKSGMTLTQIYSQYAQVSQELLLQKDETRRLTTYIQSILQEIEEKAPIIRKQHSDYENAIENLTAMQQQLDNMISENQAAREECAEAKGLANHHKKANEKLKSQMTDLGRQVCFLTKLIHEMKGDLIPDNTSETASQSQLTASSLISKKLVTFNDIQELQSNNQQLLMLVRDMSERLEKAEGNIGEADSVELQAKIDELNKRIADLQESQEQQTKMIGSVLKQRDMYQKLYQDSMRGFRVVPDMLERSEGSKISATGNNADMVSSQEIAAKDSKIKDLEDKILELKIQMNKLKEEYDTYRKEKIKNESMQHEHLEEMRKELRNVTSQNCKLVATADYNDERFKLLQSKERTLKKQISALEDKNKIYNDTILKHEQLIMYLKDETLKSQAKQSRSEVMADNLRQENTILKDTVSRLKKDHEMNDNSKQAQALLINNMESIKASFERSESEGRLRLEARLEETHRECAALRRRLQEEQDHFRELSTHLERQTAVAKERNAEAQGQAENLRVEIKNAREEIQLKSDTIEELKKKLQIYSLPDQVSGEESRKVNELEQQLQQKQSEITLLQNQLKMAKEHVKQYTDISECAEKELKDIQNIHTQYKIQSEKNLEQAALLEESLKAKIIELETELAIHNGQENTDKTAKLSLNQNEEQRVNQLQADLSEVMEQLQNCRKQISELSETVQIAEEKYAHEMVLHSSDIQAMSVLKEELSRVSQQVNEFRSKQEEASEALLVGQAKWEDRERLLIADKNEIEIRINDLIIQNSALHDQIQTLSTQLAIAHASQSADVSLNISGIADSSVSNKSLNESEVTSSEQLLEIIKYLRKEKDIALAKFDIIQAEKNRLKSQHEMVEKQLEEANKSLSAEREKSEVGLVTTAKHTEVLRTVETLNAITDSNRVLRQERDGLLSQVRDLTDRISKLEEELAPLQENNKQLQTKAEASQVESMALKAEATRWRQRANVLVERANKTSPEDWKRLQNEREALAKMLTTEKEAHRKACDELNSLKLEKAKLEEQNNLLLKQQQLQTTEIKRLNDELNSAKQQITKLAAEINETRSGLSKKTSELTKLTEELAAKDALVVESRSKEAQIRRIAKKYKDQCMDLNKQVDDDKAAMAEKTAREGPYITAAEQQAAIDEIKKEYEDRIKQLESTNSTKIAEITDQVSSSEEEKESLRKENESLKNACLDKDEKAKSVFKNAKLKIASLSESKAEIVRELEAARQQLESYTQNKDENDVRLSVLKSQYEGRLARLEKDRAEELAIKQQEANNLKNEIESLTQQVVTLQRRLQHGSKPSTSSGSGDKTTEPPTANIKPSVSTQHQSATVTPWRAGGETPLASIRPMSVPPRTAAVLPTSQTSGNSSAATQSALVPPQQQVHTTGNSGGEAMSTSPTSSHMDYMPATSSAVTQVRQVAVPPLTMQEPPSAAESTQDNELHTPQVSVATVSASPQAVALVLPRVEPQLLAPQVVLLAPQQASHSTDVVVQVSNVVSQVSQQQASSSSSVTTTVAASIICHKRPRDATDGAPGHSDNDSPDHQRKRTRMQADSKSGLGVEVEYQVATSSQRDQEDDVIVVDSEASEDDGLQEPDDGPFEDNGEDYETETYEQEQEEIAYDVDEDNDNEANETIADNNEVDVIADSHEAPNQSEGSCEQEDVTESDNTPPTGQQIQTISSGTEAGPSGSQTPTGTSFGRGRSVAPLSRQAQSMMLPQSYEEGGDDSIVPSTPTLYVPRRNDGFGEAVSSPHPHVPSARFTFGEPSSAREAPLSQGSLDGVDDTRCDLSQFHEGRSAPGTPLQVCPQVIVSGDTSEESEMVHVPIPETDEAVPASAEAIDEDVSGAGAEGEEEEAEAGGEDENKEQEEGEGDATDPVTSEGENQPISVIGMDVEEGREAEASLSPSSNTRSRGMRGAGNTARRAARSSNRGRNQQRPTPIIWNDQQREQHLRNNYPENHARGMFQRGNARGRRMRRPSPNNYPRY